MENFEKYLDLIGAQTLPKTNPYEIHRFVANEHTCVIYQRKNGRLSFSNDTAEKVYYAFLNKKRISVNKTKRGVYLANLKIKLFERDGNKCFYTDRDMTVETATIEHLIPLSKGGKNNLHNLVLCLKEENVKMADKPLIEKIKYRDKIVKEK